MPRRERSSPTRSKGRCSPKTTRTLLGGGLSFATRPTKPRGHSSPWLATGASRDSSWRTEELLPVKAPRPASPAAVPVLVMGNLVPYLSRTTGSYQDADSRRLLGVVLLALAGCLLSAARGDHEELVWLLRQRLQHGGTQCPLLSLALTGIHSPLEARCAAGLYLQRKGQPTYHPRNAPGAHQAVSAGVLSNCTGPRGEDGLLPFPISAELPFRAGSSWATMWWSSGTAAGGAT